MMSKGPSSQQVFSTFLFNVRNPENDKFRLHQGQANIPFSNELFAKVMLERELATQTTYNYVIYDTDDFIFLRNGLMLKVNEDHSVNQRRIEVLRFDWDDIYQAPICIDTFYTSATSRIDLYTKLFLDQYDVPSLIEQIAPRFPLIEPNDKIMQVKPMLFFEANILDNSQGLGETAEIGESVPIQLRHYSFELLNEQDIINSVANPAGCTFYESYQYYDEVIHGDNDKINNIVPVNRLMQPNLSEQMDWRNVLSDTFIANPLKSKTDQRSKSEKSHYAGEEIFYYDSVRTRPSNFDYYLVHVNSHRNNFYDNFLNLCLNLEMTLHFVAEPEHIHILQYLHLYNPARNYIPGAISNSYQKRLNFTYNELRDDILRVQEQLYLINQIAAYAPQCLSRDVYFDCGYVLKEIRFLLIQLMETKSKSMRTNMQFDHVYSSLLAIQNRLFFDKGEYVNSELRRMLASSYLLTGLIFLRHLYTERFGSDISRKV